MLDSRWCNAWYIWALEIVSLWHVPSAAVRMGMSLAYGSVEHDRELKHWVPLAHSWICLWEAAICSFADIWVTIKRGGHTFFRAFINSELGPPEPEVAPCIYGSNFWRSFRTSAPNRLRATVHTPSKYGARNSHISLMVLESQDWYQTVHLVLLINLVYIYMGLRWKL